MSRSYSSSAFTAAFAAALLSASSCKLKKDMDEMHDATLGMEKITEGMSKTTCVMYRSLRQGNAKLSRDQDLEDMRQRESIPGRLAEAAEYMQGFEYQVWSPTCVDETPRDVALEQNVREMIAKIQDFIKDRSKVSATQKSDNAEMLYALAGTLHYTNVLQGDFLKGTEHTVLRPFDILVKGLELDQARNRGESVTENLPTWAEIVGNYSTDVKYLLRIRANFLMAYAYALTDGDEFGNPPNAVEKIWRVASAKLLSKKWKPNLNARTATEIRGRITAAMKYSVETRAALVKLGIEPMTDETILKVWKNADFSGFDLTSMDKSPSAEVRGKSKAIRELIEARDHLLTRGAGGSW